MAVEVDDFRFEGFTGYTVFFEYIFEIFLEF